MCNTVRRTARRRSDKPQPQTPCEEKRIPSPGPRDSLGGKKSPVKKKKKGNLAAHVKAARLIEKGKRR